MELSITQAETLKMNYEVSGQGPDLLLIHGLGLSSMKTWRYQIPVLSKHFRVHAIDLRGFGKTNNPEQKFSVQQHVYDIKALMDTIGLKKVVLVGFSMGGWIAQQFALDYPERLQALVLSCTTSGLRPAGAVKFVERAENVEKHGKETLADAQIKNTFTEETIEKNPELITFYKECFLDPQENNPRSYAAMFRALSVPVVTPQLGRITCPTLIICGLKDNGGTRGDTPTDASEVIHAGIRGSELVVMPEGGHYAHLEQPEEWNQIVIDFLKGVTH
jgi:3-oxoadipate enol-lactonase